MKWLRRLWAGKPTPKVRPPINEDWRVGDLAECISDDRAWKTLPGDVPPARGRIFMVSGIIIGFSLSDGRPMFGLRFRGFRGHWEAGQFRKIVQHHEPASAEFIAEMRAKRPVSA